MMIFIYSQSQLSQLTDPEARCLQLPNMDLVLERLRGCFVAFSSSHAPFTDKKIGVSSLDWKSGRGDSNLGQDNFFFFFFFLLFTGVDELH
jgi:hypothetical protein